MYILNNDLIQLVSQFSNIYIDKSKIEYICDRCNKISNDNNNIIFKKFDDIYHFCNKCEDCISIIDNKYVLFNPYENIIKIKYFSCTNPWYLEKQIIYDGDYKICNTYFYKFGRYDSLYKIDCFRKGFIKDIYYYRLKDFVLRRYMTKKNRYYLK